MREMPRRGGVSAGLVASVLLAAALSACSTMQIASDYDVGTSFAGYRTWAWAPEPPWEASIPSGSWPWACQWALKASLYSR